MLTFVWCDHIAGGLYRRAEEGVLEGEDDLVYLSSLKDCTNGWLSSGPDSAGTQRSRSRFELPRALNATGIQ